MYLIGWAGKAPASVSSIDNVIVFDVDHVVGDIVAEAVGDVQSWFCISKQIQLSPPPTCVNIVVSYVKFDGVPAISIEYTVKYFSSCDGWFVIAVSLIAIVPSVFAEAPVIAVFVHLYQLVWISVSSVTSTVISPIPPL